METGLCILLLVLAFVAGFLLAAFIAGCSRNALAEENVWLAFDLHKAKKEIERYEAIQVHTKSEGGDKDVSV